MEAACRDEVTGEWRRLHNEQYYDLYSSPNIIRVIKLRKIRWAGHVVCMGERRGVYRVLVGRPEGKKPCGRSKHRFEDNIRRDLQEMEWGGLDWINLAPDSVRWRVLANVIMNLWVP